MTARSSDRSDTDHTALPEEGSTTNAVTTRGTLVLTLLVVAKEDVIATNGEDGVAMVTAVEAVASRLPDITTIVNIEVDPVCDAVKTITDCPMVCGVMADGHREVLGAGADCKQSQRYCSPVCLAVPV